MWFLVGFLGVVEAVLLALLLLAAGGFAFGYFVLAPVLYGKPPFTPPGGPT